MTIKNEVKIKLAEVEEDLFQKTIKIVEEHSPNQGLKRSRVNLVTAIFLKFSLTNCVTDTGTLDGNKLMQMVSELRTVLLKEQLKAVDTEAKFEVLRENLPMALRNKSLNYCTNLAMIRGKYN